MLEAVVLVALVTDHLHHLLLFAARLQTLVGEDLALALCRVRLAVTVNVLTHHNIRHLPPPHRDWGVAEGTHWDLHILLVGRGAIVLGISDVVGAEDLLAGIALQGKEV